MSNLIASALSAGRAAFLSNGNLISPDFLSHGNFNPGDVANGLSLPFLRACVSSPSFLSIFVGSLCDTRGGLPRSLDKRGGYMRSLANEFGPASPEVVFGRCLSVSRSPVSSLVSPNSFRRAKSRIQPDSVPPFSFPITFTFRCARFAITTTALNIFTIALPLRRPVLRPPLGPGRSHLRFPVAASQVRTARPFFSRRPRLRWRPIFSFPPALSAGRRRHGGRFRALYPCWQSCVARRRAS